MALESSDIGKSVNLGNLVIRDLVSLEDYAACVALQEETWGAGFSERVPTAILRVAQYVGGVSAGAFDETGRLVGFVFGLTGVRDGRLTHWSDMLAVVPELRGHGLGERLKQYQCDKVRALGVEVMLWTYDPLVAANAHFNINRLGARPTTYVPDMYGSNTGSTLHGSLPTDRFIVSWDLVRPATSYEGDGAGAFLVNPVTGAGPVVKLPTDAAMCRVQVPANFTQVQRESAALALRWRLAVREAMSSLLASGFHVVAFTRGTEGVLPSYLLARRATP